ncbi:MAG: DNA repair protein RadC [Rhodospirillales bacterium]|nr:DNA repair protein RadC [Rhodospirillales bacterium]
MSEKPHYAGHRKRLRDRFLKSGGDSLHDYEMLELILFLAQPRGDTKPIAKRLMEKFGSYGAVISASPKELSAVEGVGEAAVAALKTVRDGAVRLAREEITGASVLTSWQSLIDYCRANMAHAKNEQFHLIYLDKKNTVIADEMQQEGTVDHTAVYPREVVRRALELGATAIIMVHNHPSGDTKPSKGDIEMTKLVKETCESLSIQLHDHIIVGRAGTSSFKTLGLL